MNIKTDCFAYREVKKQKDGFEWKESKCDCLTDFVCDLEDCPFYKPAETLIQYTYKINQTPGVGYVQNES